jgi:hypothetical protein
MTRDPRQDRRKNDPPRKNPTFAVSVFIVVVLLLVIGTLIFNAVREKREFDEESAGQSSASDVKAALPPVSASQSR